MSTWHFFHLPDSGRANYAAAEIACYAVEIADDMTWQDALEYVKTNRMIPKGTNRAGCCEIQNEKGIVTAADERKLRASDVFKTWAELEAEEVENN